MSYTVRIEHGCRIVSGLVPLTDMAALLLAWSQDEETVRGTVDEWVADTKLSKALGVNLVCGTRRDTEAFRALLGV